MEIGNDSTNSSTADTRLQQLDRLIAMAVQAQAIADTLREMADKLKAELELEIEPRLPLGDD